ncbi:HpcH/HpaI aldolase family protein [Ochrobactrum sp. EDr1-4]|uniref:HpcH/HpaI aldolase family protein n=1 Tax=Ochrobactrum sp. EDr1-4 TaxID=3368622 RepID=UPI003BA176F0
MKSNTFKARLKDRQQIGLWVSLGNAASAEILARSGADWLLIDMEHSPNEISTVLEQLRAVGDDCEVIVRPPEANQTVTKRLLDIGTRSIMFPMIDTAEQARQAVSWTRYPPRGMRGISGVVRATGYGRDTASYLASEDDRICVIVQAETPTALANLEDIAAVEGVDAIFIGPGDLAASMGFTGQGASVPEVAEAIREALNRIRATSCGAGVLGYGENAAAKFFDQGADFVAVGADTWLLAQQSTSLIGQVHAALSR